MVVTGSPIVAWTPATREPVAGFSLPGNSCGDRRRRTHPVQLALPRCDFPVLVLLPEPLAPVPCRGGSPMDCAVFLHQAVYLALPFFSGVCSRRRRWRPLRLNPPRWVLSRPCGGSRVWSCFGWAALISSTRSRTSRWTAPKASGACRQGWVYRPRCGSAAPCTPERLCYWFWLGCAEPRFGVVFGVGVGARAALLVAEHIVLVRDAARPGCMWPFSPSTGSSAAPSGLPAVRIRSGKPRSTPGPCAPLDQPPAHAPTLARERLSCAPWRDSS